MACPCGALPTARRTAPRAPPRQYNTLNDVLPKYDELHKRLLRSALMGWCSSFVSDICSNSIRVIKTSKQTSTVPITYTQIVKVRRPSVHWAFCLNPPGPLLNITFA